MGDEIGVAKLYLQLASVTADGMNLELCIGTPTGGLADRGPYPLAWFRADVEGEIKFVFQTPGGAVSIPLPELERAIQRAKQDVHSERFYDDSVEGE